MSDTSSTTPVRHEADEERKKRSPQELRGARIQDGWWCEGCLTFEREEDVKTGVDTCVACGCAPIDHVPASVVGL